MRVLSDTSPLNYLVQIAQDTLPSSLFGAVSIAGAVGNELSRPRTPAAVRTWFASKPAWLIVETAPIWTRASLPRLHDGERETLELALATGVDLIVMDDRAGVVAARGLGFRVTGTLGILDLAAERKLIDIGDALTRLRSTNFRASLSMIGSLAARHGLGKTA